jgi:hypothetical protein
MSRRLGDAMSPSGEHLIRVVPPAERPKDCLPMPRIGSPGLRVSRPDPVVWRRGSVHRISLLIYESLDPQVGRGAENARTSAREGSLSLVTEVMVNGPDDVFVEREGPIERVRDRLFEGEKSVMRVIEPIVGLSGLRVDHASPWVDARLPSDSRFMRLTDARRLGVGLVE